MLLLATSICGGFVTHTIGPRLTENLSLRYCKDKLIYLEIKLTIMERISVMVSDEAKKVFVDWQKAQGIRTQDEALDAFILNAKF